MESAIISLEGKENLIPGVPIDIPSLTPIVLNISPTPFDSLTPFLAFVASSFRCMLQGFPSYPVLAMPIKGFLKSSFFNPIACSMA